MPDIDSPHGRNVYERVGALEQEMHTVLHRLASFETNHNDLPLRVSRLEQIAKTQTDLFEKLENNMEKLDERTEALGKKLVWGFGVAAGVLGIINMFGPFLIKAMAQ